MRWPAAHGRPALMAISGAGRISRQRFLSTLVATGLPRLISISAGTARTFYRPTPLGRT